MAEVQQAELADLVSVISTVLLVDSAKELYSSGVDADSMAERLAQAIVDAQNVFIGADYVKAEAEVGRTVFCILTPQEASSLVLVRQAFEQGEVEDF